MRDRNNHGRISSCILQHGGTTGRTFTSTLGRREEGLTEMILRKADSSLTKPLVYSLKSSWHLDFRHKRTRDPLWFDNRYKPIRVHSCRAHLYSGHGSSPPRDVLQSLCKEGKLDKALGLVLRMDEGGTVPSVAVYSFLLEACAKRKALSEAKRVHAHLSKHGLDTITSLGEFVVSTLVKCGGLTDALQAFHSLRYRTVVSWTALISGYTAAGQGQEALRAYECMQKQGLKPNKYTFLSLLKACGNLSDLKEGKRIHAEAMKYRYGTDVFVGTSLVYMYAKCRSTLDARNVFDALPHRNVVLWNAMLAAYAQQNQAEKAFELYEQMQQEGVSPDDRTLVSVLQVCGILAEKAECARSVKDKWLEKGLELHNCARRKGHDSHIFVANTLISLYGKCGRIREAEVVFDGMVQRNVVSWTSMLTAYMQLGQPGKALQLYDQMQVEGVCPNQWTVATALQACSMLAEKEGDSGQPTKERCLEQGKAIHDYARRMFQDSDVFVSSSLISMYGKCGSIVDALNVFDAVSHRHVVLWNALLAVYVYNGRVQNALQLYQQMQEESVSPDVRTFVSTLQACGILADDLRMHMVDGLSHNKCLDKGKAIHADARRKGCDSNIFVASTLVTMYAKCGSLLSARNVFDGMSKQNVVLWNAMMAAYVQQDHAEQALQVYEQLYKEGVSPDNRTFVSALHACGMLAEKEVEANQQSSKSMFLRRGKGVHSNIKRKGFESDILVGNALVSMYGKCGSIADAKDVFDSLPQRDVMSWNSMVTAYAQQGEGDKAVQLYQEMHMEGVGADETTLVCILQACSKTGGVDLCRQIHHSLVSSGSSVSPLLASALIDAYGKCSSMVDAQILFDGLLDPDVVSWTALITGYARQGDSGTSLQCYENMLLAGIKPDGVTFLSLLSACSHAGLVEKGIDYFSSMSRDHGISPNMEHYSSIVDLLGRAGYFSKIEDLLLAMPMCPDAAMWLCVLGACQKHCKVELGKRAFDAVVRADPKHAAAYLLMWNIYADAGLWDLANEVMVLKQRVGAWKKPGQSWVEHDQVLYSFVASDCMPTQLKSPLSFLPGMVVKNI